MSLLADQAALLVSHARTYRYEALPVDVTTLEQLAVAASQRDRLLVYAAHARGCLSTLPCSCGLDALKREVQP